MALLQKAVATLGKPLPKIISPRVHAYTDYATAGAFLLGALLFWRHNKRAAVASAVCGAAETAVALLTDYPGGVKKVISFPVHKQLDFGLATMAATMPEFLKFEDERESAFFRIQSLGMTGVTALTKFEPQRREGEREARVA